MVEIRQVLENILSDRDFDNLPEEWENPELKRFSTKKELWDFQKEALESAIKVLYLWKNKGKSELFELYKKNSPALEAFGLEVSERVKKLTEGYYNLEGGKLMFRDLVNRASFWLATGSGKTLIIVKLIHAIKELAEKELIPDYPVLFLTHREDLIRQFIRHLEEANSVAKCRFLAISLKEIIDIQSGRKTLAMYDYPVYYYRSDLLSDEQKQNIIDFRQYENKGEWYIILDEAHRGGKEESLRQHIYNIMSRNGFLFNFSATFTDPLDIITTAYTFNLSNLVNKGYAKHIYVLREGFPELEEEREADKKKAIFKSLILLSFIKKHHVKGYYHNPLLVYLVNSVNEAKSDMHMLFEELRAFAEGNIDSGIFYSARDELYSELAGGIEPFFEGEASILKLPVHEIKQIDVKDVLFYVFNAHTHGELEISFRPSDRSQCAFKLKTSDSIFALIKTGDMPKWLREELENFNINENFEKESYFERLNEPDSSINILIGSRAFYEGWDSDRPNVIVFINIGKDEEAKKFLLQAVGRGVRIQPLRGRRKRLLNLYNSGQTGDEFELLKDHMNVLETLFVFATKPSAIKTILEGLKSEERKRAKSIKLTRNREIKKANLLVPVYREVKEEFHRDKIKFPVSKTSLERFETFVNSIGNDLINLILLDVNPAELENIKTMLKSKERYFYFNSRDIKEPHTLARLMLEHFRQTFEEFENFKELEDEIKHYRDIKVYLEDISELARKIKKVRRYKVLERLTAKLYGKISRQEYEKLMEQKVKKDTFEHEGQKLSIKHIEKHYYLPVLMSEGEKVAFISNIIKHKSEAEFLKALEECVKKEKNPFKEVDCWAFSKIQEKVDDIYIPYIDRRDGRLKRYYPDFIFWLQKGKDYYIVFVDPKGTEHTDYQYKLEGYMGVFDGKVFRHEGKEVRVFLYMYTQDTARLPEAQRGFWKDNVCELFSEVLRK